MTERIHIAVRGAVQGVGFRPFIFRLATELRLTGWVLNSPQGVFIEAEGNKQSLDAFVLRMDTEKPPLASIQSMEFAFFDPRGDASFEIRESMRDGELLTLVLPDIATCQECQSDIFDPTNRRYLYPFTNCTNCGPRFTIIESLPYDRPNTSMKVFPMCDACRREYTDPSDRRFHAQPIACPDCGPHITLWDPRGIVLGERLDALRGAAQLIREGKIVAVKGLGGFHLIVDARNDGAIQTLRRRKRREEKPFALMAPDVETVRQMCEVSPLEQRLLSSPESPIVLLAKRPSSLLHPRSPVAPQNPYLGVMIPYTPLHHLLLRELGFPVVATSGNIADEPMCIDEHEALDRLRGTADVFLVHNRPIVRHADDSIARVLMGRELVMRRARGYSPLPVPMRAAAGELLAVGAHLKNTVAVAKEADAFLSQHIGDLETRQSLEAFHRAVADLQEMFGVRPKMVVSDLHPDYLSTQFARGTGLPHLSVQHHHAHVASCMAENGLDGPVLGVSWDGTGYGTDGTVWGGEFLRTAGADFERVATFRSFRLPGGERAVREPRRAALGLLYGMYGSQVFERDLLHPIRAFTSAELKTLRTMLARDIHAPSTSSAGRLFDAVASLIGLRQVSRFEGQAAMELEFQAGLDVTSEAYGFRLLRGGQEPAAPVPAGGFRGGDPDNGTTPLWIIDWSSVIEEILADLESHVPLPVIATKFHYGLTEAIVDVARLAGEPRVVLSGGCFQNCTLSERTVLRLRQEGFQPYWHQRVPPNDGGIALGQLYVAAMKRKAQSS